MGIFWNKNENADNTKEKEKICKSEKIMNPKIEKKCSIEYKKNNPINANENKPKFLGGNIELERKVFDEAVKSVCKIIVERKMGSGFFLKIDGSKKYLITAYHVISENDINEDINLEIYNKTLMVLKLENRDIKYLKEKDITIIEIKEADEIFKDIKFLYYDSNYIYGYEIYKNKKVLNLRLLSDETFSFATGVIKEVNNFQFEHTISMDWGSSGGPIILLNDNSNDIPVIGIHKGGNQNKKTNIGIFIGEIFFAFKKSIDLKNNEICVVLFISIDQSINYPFSCKIVDNFSCLENKLFEQFPKLKNKNIYFLANGNVINRSATLLDNKIKNDTTILIDYNDE